MKRFLWAAILALFIHVLLFGFGGRFLNREILKPLPQTLSFTLVADRPKPDSKKAVKTPAKAEISKPPEPEKKAVPTEALSPPVIEEKTPVVEEIPELEEIPEEKELPEEEPPEPEPEKVIPKVTTAPEKKPVKLDKPAPPKKPAPEKKVEVKKKKKVVKRPTKKNPVKKKAAKIEPLPRQPKKETTETPVEKTTKEEMTSKPPDVSSQSPSANEKSKISSGPKVVKASPSYARNPRPKYPRVARRRGYEGVVLLKVMVDREGRVDDLVVLKSSGHGVLDRSALNAVKNWVFQPGTIDGRRTKMWVQVPVRFELKGR